MTHPPEHPLFDELLSQFRTAIGEDFTAYRNHLRRLLRFCLLLKKDADEIEIQKLTIAAVFHDLGIWTHDTFDYLNPSAELAREYLLSAGRSDWIIEIGEMIHNHHRFRRYSEEPFPLIEIFRKADWIDVSLGILTFGIPRNEIKKIREEVPNSGFHKRLLRLTGREFRRHPLRPLPMMKW